MTAFVDVPQSLSITTKSGVSRSYSTLDDYVNSLIQKEVISGLTDLVENHIQLISEIQHHWIKAGQTGCLFAAKLAKTSTDPWVNTVVTGLTAHEEAYVMIDAAINQAFDRKADGIQVIIPEISTGDALVEFLKQLSSRNGWCLDKIKTEKDPVFGVGLRWVFPDDKFVSWILGFSPLASMPVTRRAPFTSIIMRLGGPGRCPEVAGYPDRPKDNITDMSSVHLADLDDGLSSEELVCKYWKGTQYQKKELLAGELEEAARARITFSLDRQFDAAIDEIVAKQK